MAVTRVRPEKRGGAWEAPGSVSGPGGGVGSVLGPGGWEPGWWVVPGPEMAAAPGAEACLSGSGGDDTWLPP